MAEPADRSKAVERVRLRGDGRPADYARRDLLRAAAGLPLLLGVPGCDSAARPELESESEPRVRHRPVLGHTGIAVSDIGFGSYDLAGDVGLVHHALDRGITHFDTAESYQDGRSEETLGSALEGRRDAVTLTTKIAAGADERRDALMAKLEASLRRLRTDRVDFHLNHAVDDVARLDNPEWQEFAHRAKQQGKIRFAGMSGHGPNLAACLGHALDHDLVDVILVAYNYVQSPDWIDHARRYWEQLVGGDWVALQSELPALLERARTKGVGVMVMKTLRGARRNDMRPYERGRGTFAQAAFRWVLSDPRVGSLVVSMSERAQIDEYLAASGESPTSADLALLARYEAMNRGSQCIQGCNACRDACPEGVPISDVLRTRMYAVDYGRAAAARREYAALERDASRCASCAAPCLSACPSGIAIAELTRDAHERLG